MNRNQRHLNQLLQTLSVKREVAGASASLKKFTKLENEHSLLTGQVQTASILSNSACIETSLQVPTTNQELAYHESNLNYEFFLPSEDYFVNYVDSVCNSRRFVHLFIQQFNHSVPFKVDTGSGCFYFT